MGPKDFNPFSDASLKRKLKRGPKLSRKLLAYYAMNVAIGRFEHHPFHVDKPGEPRAVAQHVPKLILEFMELLPREIVSQTCALLGHPSFWLDVGPRFRCVCGDLRYKD